MNRLIICNCLSLIFFLKIHNFKFQLIYISKNENPELFQIACTFGFTFQLDIKLSSYKNCFLFLLYFQKEMNNFVVVKFLSLVFFLDQAKSRHLIPYDPCLFCKNSPIKVKFFSFIIFC